MRHVVLTALLLAPVPLLAQAAAARPAAPSEQQIAGALIPLPAEFRATATVLGYNGKGEMVPLRAGSGEMICLADAPADTTFHTACYHKSMEPFMARGRALRAAGTTGSAVDSVRFSEVKSGKLVMPTRPAALWQVTGPHSAIDIAAQTYAAPARALYVVYMPGATAASTGIPAQAKQGLPWIMYPGTPKAHIMFVPTM